MKLTKAIDLIKTVTPEGKGWTALDFHDYEDEADLYPVDVALAVIINAVIHGDLTHR